MYKKILWVRPDAIGDALLANSMLSPIKKYYDHAQITVICQQHLAELYQTCPLVSNVIGIDKKKFVTDLLYRDDLLARLRAEQFDYALNSVYSREASMDCLTTGIGARHSIGFGIAQPRSLFNFSPSRNDGYTKLITSVGSKPELERHRDFLVGLGIIAHDQVTDLAPQIWTSQSDENFAYDFFTQHQLAQENTIAFFAGAQSAHRLYQQYGKALNKAFAGRDITIIAFGAQSDRQINAQNCAQLTFKHIDLSGQTTLTQTAALLRRCSLAFGAETGLAHMACAVAIPNVIVLGGGHFGRFMPYSPLTTAVILPLQCYGCDWRCRYKKAYCIQDIHPDVVGYALQKTLDEPSPQKPRLVVQGRGWYQAGFFNPSWGFTPKVFQDLGRKFFVDIQS